MQNSVTIKVGGHDVTITKDIVIAKALSCDTNNLDQKTVHQGVVVNGKLCCVTTLARHIADAASRQAT